MLTFVASAKVYFQEISQMKFCFVAFSFLRAVFKQVFEIEIVVRAWAWLSRHGDGSRRSSKWNGLAIQISVSGIQCMLA